MNLIKIIDHILLALACIFAFESIILKNPIVLFLDVAWFFFNLCLLKRDGG